MNAISELAPFAPTGSGQSAEIDKIAAALAAAQGKFTNPPKNAVNPHFKSRFASLDAIVEMARPHLAEQGLAVVQLVGTESGTTVLRSRLIHASGQWLECVIQLFNTNKGPQVFGSELTYQRRYGLCALLNIVADSDDDAQAAQRDRDQAPPASPRRVARPVQAEGRRDDAAGSAGGASVPAVWEIVSGSTGQVQPAEDGKKWVGMWRFRLEKLEAGTKDTPAQKRATLKAMNEANADVFASLSEAGHGETVQEVTKACAALDAKLVEQERAQVAEASA